VQEVSGPAELMAKTSSDNSEKPIHRVDTGLAVSVIDYDILAGGRAGESTTGADYKAVSEEWAISAAIDLSVDAGSTIYNGPCLVGGAFVEVVVAAGNFVIFDGTVARMTVPVAFALFEHTWRPFVCKTSFIVTPAAATTGSVRFFYKPIPVDVTWPYT